jgi:hypothetical protein
MDEKEQFFETRLRKHIATVQKYARKIAVLHPKHKPELLKSILEHDASKFLAPERGPYVYISWKYKHKREGNPYEMPEGMAEKALEATVHHVKHNTHHAEYYEHSDDDVICRQDRDAPARLIDATKMPIPALLEMVADWMAVGEENGNTCRSWADKNVNIRWKFTDAQKKIIYDTIDKIEGQE